MWIKTGLYSLLLASAAFSVSNTAWAGGRRTIVYFTEPQVANRDLATPPGFKHTDALTELRSRSSGVRGLQADTVADLEARLQRLEQKNNLSTPGSRAIQNDRAVGLAAVEIAATVLGVLKQIEDSSSPKPNGVQEADAIVQALIPVLQKNAAANAPLPQPVPANQGAPVTPAVNPQADSAAQLLTALQSVQAAVEKYNADQAKQKQLQDAAKAALKKIAEQLQQAAQ